MKPRIRSMIWAIGAATAMAFAAGQAMAQQTSKLYEVLDRGHVIVGVTSEVPPFGSVGENGELVGFDIDIARLIAKALFEDPDKIEFKKLAFPARWAAVNNGEVDFGIMVTTIWPDRLARVNFTRGYIRSGLSLLTRTDIEADEIQDFNNSDYTVAILDTPSEHKLMAEKLPEAKTLVLPSEADMLTAVRTNRADALLIDQPVAAWRVRNIPDIKNLGIVGSSTQNAIFMRQNDFQWWYYLDALVQEMRCGSLYEEYKAIYNKWFNVDPPSPDRCIAFAASK
ncbi:MAG TPA: transporter substrate-binding domain-containing protein [Hyphomicrobiaceae bacterium]